MYVDFLPLGFAESRLPAKVCWFLCACRPLRSRNKQLLGEAQLSLASIACGPRDWQPVHRVGLAIFVVKSHCLCKAEAGVLLSEGLLEPAQTCMNLGTWSDLCGRNSTCGHVFSS